MENNYDILGIREGSTKKEIQDAFRKLVLLHHSDRGGNIEQFKKIKQAYEDLKQGKKYPDSPEQKKQDSRVYSGDDEEETRRRNKILAGELHKEMAMAQEWAAAHNRAKTTGSRLFGSKTLGEMEFERKANGALSIKGNIMAGNLSYDGPVMMQGNITSPSFGDCTNITLTRGDFKFVNPVENKYRIENGSRITALNGNIVVGNVFGKKNKIQDPSGKTGLYVTVEHRTHLYAPLGKIIVENVANTVNLDCDTVISLNLEDDVRIKAKDIMIYGNKVTYDVEFALKRGGILRFFEKNSVLSLSDDAIVMLENGKIFLLHDLKTKKIRSLAPGLVPPNLNYDKDDTMVGRGFPITYEMLDNFDGPARAAGQDWQSRLSFWKTPTESSG